MSKRVLVVDDQSNVRKTVSYLLEKEGYEVVTAASGKEALDRLEDQSFEFALIDVKMAQMDGLELLRRIRARWTQISVILMTAYASIPSAVDAMKMGAAHYLEKPFTRENLLDAFEMAKSDRGQVVAASGSQKAFRDLVGSTPEMRDALALAQRNAVNDKVVTITGELGTGKETLARAIHGASPREKGPFLIVRCSSGSENLAREIFGGSTGRLVEANGGSIYLDRVDQLNSDTQAQLLRFLQDGEWPTEGAVHRSDARVMVSTTSDLEDLVENVDFRQDLYHRLKSVTIRLPALQDRRADISKLVQHFAKAHRPKGSVSVRFDRSAISLLMKMPFSGNLRELDDLVEQALSLAGGLNVTANTLSKLGFEPPTDVESGSQAMRQRVDLEERRVIEEELRKNPRNLKQAATNLNISRTTLWRKMKKHGLDSR